MKNVIDQKPSEYTVDNYARFKTIKQTSIKGKRVLDIGCGYGWCDLLLAEAGAKEVVGIEITEEDLATAKKHLKHPNVRYEVGSAIELPFEDNSFDTVVSWEVLEHIPPGTEKQMFKEVARVLKKGGRFYMSTPYAHPVSNLINQKWMFTRGGHRHYSRKKIDSYAKAGKLKVESFTPKGSIVMLSSVLNMYISKWVFRRPPLFHNWWQRRVERDLAGDRPKYANIFAHFKKA